MEPTGETDLEMAKKKVDAGKIREEQIEVILKELQGTISAPETAPLETRSLEYRRFVAEEEKAKPLLYEKLCRLAEKANIEPEPARRTKLERSISFAHMNATPTGTYSLAILSFLIAMVLSAFLMVLGKVSFTIFLSLVAVSMALFYVLLEYPVSQAKIFRVKASSEIILAIIYMVIFMRSSPNLEGAVRFAATNLSGPLSLDLRKVLWDVETGKYTTLDEALDEYLQKWEDSPEFTESLQLIKSSREQIEANRHGVLDEAVNVILNGTMDKMKDYSRLLRMPVLLIHAIGVMLPILVLVMFPILILFLKDSVKPIYLVMGYDVVLPLFIYFLGKRVLEYRSFGLSAPDISLHPKYAPLGMVRIAGFSLPMWPLGLVAGTVVSLIGIALMGTVPKPISFEAMLYSLVITWGIGLGFIVFFLMDTRRKMAIRDEIRKFQDEFSESLFTLGNKMSLGKPIEAAMEEVAKKEKDLAISDMFNKAVRNIKEGGLTTEAAIFDKEFGAVWEYPSKIIINIMRIILDATRKSAQIASTSALSISRYLKQIHRVEEELKDMLSEATSSMRFLGMFLAPLIAGITVTMAGIMMLIFAKLGESFEVLQESRVPGFNSVIIGGWGDAASMLPIGPFQIVVGVYVIQIAYLLSFLTAGIEDGLDDVISRRYLAGWSLVIGLLVYTFSMLITYSMFGNQIEGILTGGGF